MKILNALFIIVLSLGLVSCTESIAPELEEANRNGGGGLPGFPSDHILKTFSVDAIKFNEDDSVTMHKANQPGSEKCKIEAISLDSNAPAYQDCVVDIEELDLFYQGVTFDIQVSDRLCEYVAFLPYKFYSHPVGSTNANYTDSSECTCGTCPTHNPPPENPCQFNYDGNRNCDEGQYTVTKYTSYEEDDGTGTMTCVTEDPTTETYKCDGSRLACVQTADPDLLDDMKIGGLITKAEPEEIEDEDGNKHNIYQQEYALRSPQLQGDSSNRRIANFSRYCSGADPVLNEQTGMNFSNILAKFHRQDVNETLPLATVYAASPTQGEYAQPLYLVQCLDQAGDVKGEIRFVVREWDRSFKNHSNPAILSYVKVNGTLDDDDFNEYEDLDDFIATSGTNYYNNSCHTNSFPLGYNPDHFFYDNI